MILVYWNPPKFLNCSCTIRNDNVVFCHLLISVCSGSFSSFDKGPIWVATGFKCSPDVFLFLLLPLWLSGHGLRWWFEVPPLVLPWVMRVRTVLVCVYRFSVHLIVEASFLFSVYCSVQEGQTVSFYCPEHSCVMWRLSVPLLWFWPRFHPNTWTSGLEQFLLRLSALNFFHVEVGHFGGDRWAHGTAVILSVETVTIGSRWSSDRGQVRHKCSLGKSLFRWTECCLVAGISSPS